MTDGKSYGRVLLDSVTFRRPRRKRENCMIHRAQRWCCVALSFLCLAAAPSQQTVAQAPAKFDYSAEPFVFEKMATAIAFQNDGSYAADATLRIRAQSQAAVQQFGLLSLPYASATSTLDIDYVRVIKPGGQVIETPLDGVLEIPSPVTQEAPFYSDLKQKQIAVKGLALGDTIEYRYHEAGKALDPGQFWYSFNFARAGIWLDEQLQISVPEGRYVKVQSPDVTPTIEHKNGRTIYSWTTKHLQGVAEKSEDEVPADRHPSVQLTTFHSWAEVGAWFYGLVAPQAVPSPEVRAKALELTRDAKADREKMEAIYKFVSANFRYIGISFGIGRYQPHPASEVLTNDYGDCKDKHTLLTALLAAAGIKAYPVLVDSDSDVDVDVPSPIQFDHVITAVPQGDGFLFLDATPEVAPFGYLVAPIRGKKVLVAPEGKPALLVQTPNDPPFESFYKLEADGTLDDSGTLQSKMHMSFRGDEEIGVRLGLRQVSPSQLDQFMQAFSSELGFGGTVEKASVSKIDATDVPLEINYSYTRKNYSDWEDKQIGPPFPGVPLVEAPDESVKKPQPLKLGSPREAAYQATLKLPTGAKPQLPSAVSLRESFADYDSSYSVLDGVLHVERKLKMKGGEVPVDRLDAYRKFVKAVNADERRYIPVFASASAQPLDYVSTPEASDLMGQGVAAVKRKDYSEAARQFQRSVNADPNFALAWFSLGYAHVRTGDRTAGIAEIKKSAHVTPFQPVVSKQAARALQEFDAKDDALEVWQEVEKQTPNDPDAARTAGSILMQGKKYREALVELQAALKIDPSRGIIRQEIGEAHLHMGEVDQAVAEFREVLALDRSPDRLNDIAYEMADNDVGLDEALQFAQEAVKRTEDQTQQIVLEKVGPKELSAAENLASYWDTLGWVHFRMGHADVATDYLSAAWGLDQNATVADHLGQVYEKQGKTHEAAVAYGHALSVAHPDPETQKRLDALRPGGHYQVGEKPDPAALQSLREVKLPRIYSGSANAQFYVLFSDGGKTVATKFSEGSEALREKGEAALRNAKFNVPFPAASAAQILRKGVLDCETVVPKCSFVLFPLGN